MKIQYFSEVLNKVFDSEEALLAAEAKVKAEKEAAALKRKQEEQARKIKNEARAKDAHEVDEAFKVMVDAQKAYRAKLSEFCSKWGAYHTSIRDNDEIPSFNSLLDAVAEVFFGD